MVKLLVILLMTSLMMSTISHAKPRGKSSTTKSTKSTYKKPKYLGGYSSTTTSSSSYGVPAPPTPVKPLPIQQGITVRKAGVRTCEFEECTVVRYLPKDEKISWQISTDKFIKIHGVNAWIKKDDVKKTK